MEWKSKIEDECPRGETQVGGIVEVPPACLAPSMDKMSRS